MEKTNDEIIAVFIGGTIDRATSGGKRLWNFSSLSEFCKQIDISENRVRVFYADDLRFSTSWDWLIPCVEKIDKLYRENFPPDFLQRLLDGQKEIIDHHYMDVIAIPLATPISEVYANVVTFIRWYNTQPKQS